MLRSLHPYVQAELDAIKNSVNPPIHFKITVVLHVNGQDVNVPLVNIFENEADYLSKYAEYIKISVLMERSTYDKVVYPNLDLLEMVNLIFVVVTK